MKNVLFVTSKTGILGRVIESLRAYNIQGHGVVITVGSTESSGLEDAFRGMDAVFFDNGVLPDSLSDGHVEVNGLVQFWRREKGLSLRECRVFQMPFSGEGSPFYLDEIERWIPVRAGQYRDADFISGLFTSTRALVH